MITLGNPTREKLDSNVNEWIPGRTFPSLPASEMSSGITRGFPRANLPIHEWIPGISTPEGLLLGSMTAAAVFASSNPHLFERIIQSAATAMIVGVGTAIPAGAVWFGSTLFHQ